MSTYREGAWGLVLAGVVLIAFGNQGCGHGQPGRNSKPDSAPLEMVPAERPAESGAIPSAGLVTPPPTPRSADLGSASEGSSPLADAPQGEPQPSLERFTIRLAGTALALEFAAVVGPTGQTYWLSTSEVPWEAYDVFLFGFDLPADQRVSGWDAKTRPSRPYGSPDRGLGHRGFAAQAMSAHAAEGFCSWLASKSGVELRLPTANEWEWAARGAEPRGAGLTEDLAPPRRIPAELGQQVGFAPYEGPRPAALNSLPADALGLKGLCGNLCEWVRDDRGLGHLTAGGCFLDDLELCRPERRETQAPSWNETDPQNPKSRWWLANAPFVGFRILAESPPR